MRHSHAMVLISRALLLAGVLGFVPATGRTDEFVVRVPLPPPSPDMVVPDQFVVAFKRDVAHRLSIISSPGRPHANLASVQRALDRAAVLTGEREFVSARPQSADSRYPDLTGYYLVRIPEGASLEAAMAAIDRKSTRLNSSHIQKSRMPSSA